MPTRPQRRLVVPGDGKDRKDRKIVVPATYEGPLPEQSATRSDPLTGFPIYVAVHGGPELRQLAAKTLVEVKHPVRVVFWAIFSTLVTAGLTYYVSTHDHSAFGKLSLFILVVVTIFNFRAIWIRIRNIPRMKRFNKELAGGSIVQVSPTVIRELKILAAQQGTKLKLKQLKVMTQAQFGAVVEINELLPVLDPQSGSSFETLVKAVMQLDRHVRTIFHQGDAKEVAMRDEDTLARLRANEES